MVMTKVPCMIYNPGAIQSIYVFCTGDYDLWIGDWVGRQKDDERKSSTKCIPIWVKYFVFIGMVTKKVGKRVL